MRMVVRGGLACLACAGALWLGLGRSAGAQGAVELSFLREHLEFKLLESEAPGSWPEVLEVSALYAFGNPSGRTHRQQVRYPWPRTREMGPVESIDLRWQPGGEPVALVGRDSSSVSFLLELQPGEEKLLAIQYRQAVRGGRCTYLLTTARSWGRPIQEAQFLLRLPRSFVADSCSLKPDGCRESDGERLCFWKRLEFLPEQDFVIWYRRLEP